MTQNQEQGREQTTKQAMIQMAGYAPAIRSIDAIALYNPRDGRVVHLHHVVTFEGAERLDPEEQKRGAMDVARRFVSNVDDLKVLHVADFQPRNMTYRVDLEAQRLIEIPPLRNKPAE